jgi:DNA-binding XRE family transcriptional regulator
MTNSNLNSTSFRPRCRTSCSRRQDRNQRKEVLQGTDRQGGCAIRAAPGEVEDREKDRRQGEKEMKTLHNKLKALPADRRNKIAARTDELIRKEMTMRELRKARNITQVELAKELNVKQEQISRIEKRSDLLISTLRRQVEALGGELTILASFPQGAPVKIVGFGELEA